MSHNKPHTHTAQAHTVFIGQTSLDAFVQFTSAQRVRIDCDSCTSDAFGYTCPKNTIVSLATL